MSNFRENREDFVPLIRESQVVNKKVRNLENEDVGKIENLMIDPADGRVVYAVLSFGGFLGMGTRLFAIPWASLSFDVPRDEFVLNVDKDRLRAAPGFDRDDWPNMSEPRWRNQIAGHYGHPGVH